MSDQYRTFAQQFYLQQANWRQKIGRDLRLLKWLFMNVLMWFKARKVRQEFEQCRANGEPFFVDKFAGPPKK